MSAFHPWVVYITTRAHHGLPTGILYLFVDRINATNFLKILSPWSSRSIENWLRCDLKLLYHLNQLGSPLSLPLVVLPNLVTCPLSPPNFWDNLDLSDIMNCPIWVLILPNMVIWRVQNLVKAVPPPCQVDLNGTVIWAAYLQIWCHRSLDMVKKSVDHKAAAVHSPDIKFEGRWPKLILNHNSHQEFGRCLKPPFSTFSCL